MHILTDLTGALAMAAELPWYIAVFVYTACFGGVVYILAKAVTAVLEAIHQFKNADWSR